MLVNGYIYMCASIYICTVCVGVFIPFDVIFLIILLSESATNKSPVVKDEIPIGLLNLASVPTSSTYPDRVLPPPPARVDTTPTYKHTHTIQTN